MAQQKKRASMVAMEADAAEFLGNWIHEKNDKINNFTAFFKPKGPPKTQEQIKLEEQAKVIRTFRPVMEDDEAPNDRPWVDHPCFDLAACILVVLNALIIGIEADQDSREDGRDWWWITIEFLFLVLFMTEIGVKFRYHGWGWLCMDWMNMFILVVCILLFVDAVILQWCDTPNDGVLRLFSMARIIGILRLSKAIGLRKRLEELKLVLAGITESFQTIAWVVSLLAVYLYVFGCFATSAIGHNREAYANYRKTSGGWDHEEWFGTVGRSMFTMLQVMTLDGWNSRVARHVITNQWHMAVFFIVFLLLSTYGLLLVIVSVIVEHTLKAAEINRQRATVREDRARRKELQGLGVLFAECDTDGSGNIDLEEFLEACTKPKIQWRLRMLELPVSDAAHLFTVIDGDGSRELTREEFINGCMKMKGPAQAKDLLQISAQADTLSTKMDLLSSSIAEGERMIGALDEISKRINLRTGTAIRGAQEKHAERSVGAAPVKVLKRRRPGVQEETDFSVGNRAELPSFPQFLR